MKKYHLIVWGLALLPLLANCSKVLKTETKSFNQTLHYAMDAQTGTIFQSAMMSKAELISRLGLPDNARITAVEIQALSANVRVNPNNAAPRAIASATIREFLDGTGNIQDRILFENKELSFSPTTGVWVGWVPINTLVGEGIGLLKDKLAQWLADYNNYTGEAVFISLYMSSQPANTRIALDFDLKIQASIQFEYCATTSKLLGSSGLECEDDILK